tara:strand:+ start:400 stop:561 length:162 start_codon:yes stop_codon:yes gene_type:complete
MLLFGEWFCFDVRDVSSDESDIKLKRLFAKKILRYNFAIFYKEAEAAIYSGTV